MEYRDRTFEHQRITLDGNTFTGCTFRHCELVFSGTADLWLVANHITECVYTFTGPATRTLQFLQALYHSGERQVVNEIIRQLRMPLRS